MKKESCLAVVYSLKDLMSHTGIKLQKNKYDFFADRLRVAASEPSLLGVIQKFAQMIQSPYSALNEAKFKQLLVAATHDDADLRQWLWQQADNAIAIAKMENPELGCDAVIATFQPQGQFAYAQRRRPFDVAITAIMEEALSHADETKSGNLTLFRRNKPGWVFYSGNAWGGAMRDLLADHFLSSLGISIDRARPGVDAWFFHMMYNGGIMADGAIPKEFEKRLCGGAAGGVRTDGMRELRNMIPFFSMLGGVGKYPIEGYIHINSLRPQCLEWGTGDKPQSAWLGWRFISRRDDSEFRVSAAQIKSAKEEKMSLFDEDSDATEDVEVLKESANTSMIVNTEVLSENTILEGGIDVSPHMTELEFAAFAKGMLLMQEYGYLGGKKRRGGGRANIEYACKPGIILNSSKYETYLQEHAAEILTYLKEIGANPRKG